jgi:phosphoribosylformylglycinamidine synthase
MILNFNGVSAISDFRSGKLLQQLKGIQPSITQVSAEYIHFVKTSKKINEKQKEILRNLLTYDIPYMKERSGKLLLTVPRPGTISPWSSKATAIADNSNLPVDRIERGVAYYIKSGEKLNKVAIADLLHDRMTESVLEDAEAAGILFESHEPKKLATINILDKGIDELRKANIDMGLALSEDEIGYLYGSYKKIDRNPTDLELMMFGVVNSEHCRHKIFNADWFIDGRKQPKSLFKMIKNTYEKHPEGIISAYSDNSAILHGSKEKQLSAQPETGIYEEKTEQSHMVIKVETHNHPTAIAPFPGAATGSGGEIRDENATGRGAKPKMGLCGFSVSNLHIPGFTQPWETDSSKPDRIASPLEIMIKGPIGGASFNNEFGRPNTAGYFRTYEQSITDGQEDEIRGYHKPIMIAGGIGSIKDTNTAKKKLKPETALIVIGGPSMLIGLAGGAASSMESGKSDSELDFASVQRGNAEIQRRAHEVISACSDLGEKNPIDSIHDVGAGGLSNALTELVHDSGLGAVFELRDIDSAESGLSPMEIWCNEAQERYVLGVSRQNLELFKAVCEKERCPYSVVGKTTKQQQLVINDSLFKNQPANIPLSLLFGGPPKITKRTVSKDPPKKRFETSGIDTSEAIRRVLQVPTVGSKKFLITIGDRNVGGLIARDQMIGPWQVPVSDCAVSATGFSGATGEAMAMGERTPLAIIDSPASARMAIAEAITNIASAKIDNMSDIKLSANWMAASGYKSEDFNLYQAVKTAGEEFCPELNLTIPVGKDSLSMRTVWEENGKSKSVTSPVSLIISAFAPVSDINLTLTPELKKNIDSTLIFIDLAEGKTRLGGSCLAQAYNNIGTTAPDADSGLLKSFFESLQELKKHSMVKAYHDRSDGGLITTLLEMAFAGRSGLKLDISKLPGTTIEKLFNEELGVVLQVADKDLNTAGKILSKNFEGHFYMVGKPNGSNKIVIKDSGKSVLDASRRSLEKLWSSTSYRIQRIRDNEKCAEEEFNLIEVDDDPGINPKANFKNLYQTYPDRPKVAILREQGVNGQNEMAAAFMRAGFTAIDVHMQDLQNKKFSLEDFVGLAACGGFSYGDVLGAGLGWAKGILYDDLLKEQFKGFFERPGTFSLGVCNGCQMLAGLKDIIPGAKRWPKFLKNKSEQFEARFISVKINESPSIFFNGMGGSVLPIPVAHGEGRAVFDDSKESKRAVSDKFVPLQFVDNHHRVTETYPLNPNGSEQAIASLCSDDGRALIMMPHPERAFLTYQHSWHPADWDKDSPWLRMFQNARAWVEKK